MAVDERDMRMQRVAELGIEIYMQAHGVDRGEAIRRMREAGATGRNESECAKRNTTA